MNLKYIHFYVAVDPKLKLPKELPNYWASEWKQDSCNIIYQKLQHSSGCELDFVFVPLYRDAKSEFLVDSFWISKEPVSIGFYNAIMSDDKEEEKVSEEDFSVFVKTLETMLKEVDNSNNNFKLEVSSEKEINFYNKIKSYIKN